MKYMKLGTTPDHIFFTQQALRTVSSDTPPDFTIRINDITYLLHKLPLLHKCGLLRRLCSANTSHDESGNLSLDLHDIPGGDDAFQLCAKYCYGITIILSAHNFVSAFCAAKFLQMTDAVDDDNFIPKLEAFFSSCILQGWKDSIAALQSTATVPEWSESPGIVRRCIDSIVDKILHPPEKVTWSFTYTRVGYERKRHKSVPKDWWTEDVSDLDIDLFRCILTAVRSGGILPPQLIGEALHVYASRWLPDDVSTNDQQDNQQKKILEIIVSLIPLDHGILPVVSTGFLLKLLRLANLLGVSAGTKAELIRRSGWQLETAKLNDLLIPSTYDIDLVCAILESYLKRRSKLETSRSSPMMKVGKVIDSYLEVVAMDGSTSVQQLVSLAASIPEMARPQHDQLYKAINSYLQKHPDLPKADKRELCGILDCHKLSPEIQRDVVRNERLPLRTVVQLLFFNLEAIRIRCNQCHPRQPLTGSSNTLVEDPDPLMTNLRARDEKRRYKLRMEPIAPLRHQASEKGKEIREPMIRQR